MNGERLGLSLGGSGRTRTPDIICILRHIQIALAN